MAADSQGRSSIRSLGAGKCSDLTAAVEQKDAARLTDYGSWLSGYLSAVNRLVGKTYDALPTTRPSDAIGIVAVICQQNNEKLIENVAYQAIETLNDIRVRDYSPMITAKKDGESLTISEQTIRFVQVSLKTSGHYRGDVDGQWSSSLSSSISKYQGEQNLPKTGLPDIDVVIRIKYVTQNKKME